MFKLFIVYIILYYICIKYYKTFFKMTTIHTKFEKTVSKYSNNIAYVHNSKKFTYKSINNAANNLAEHIVNNYKDSKIICIFLDQGVDNIVSLFAVSKSAKTILPLNTMMPIPRLVNILEQYNVNTIITNTTYFNELKQTFNGNIIIPKLDFSNKQNLNINIAETFNFIIFNTSGSTGNPKGVIQTHKNMLFSTTSYINLYDIKPNDNHSLVYPTGFLGGIRDVFVALLTGSTLFYYDKYGSISLPDWVIQNKINILSLPIKFLRDLFKNIINDDIKFNSVKVVRPGGDVSYRSDFEKFKQHFPNAKYYILYASSETGIVLQNILSHSDIITTDFVPLGNSINEVEAYIVDDNDNIITNDNIPGRLLIKSKYLFKGYVNDEEKTNKVLNHIKDYSIFKTNDIVKYVNGQIYFEERIESHVKINGARVNPNYIASIASNIVDNPYCMFSKKYNNLYLFYETNKNIRETDVKKYLFDNLEFYMVPARCIKVDKLPQKENGKIDRLLIDQTIDALIKQYDNTKITNLHKTLINIFENNLNKQNIKITDNYFDNLGGDSLTAQLIITDIEHDLSISLKDNILYEYSTIKELANELENNSSNFFKRVKHIIKGDSKLIPIVWITGYPNIIRKHLKYKGDFYYVDSHYNQFANIPSIKDNIIEYSKLIVEDIINEVKSNKIILAGYSIGSVYAIEISKQLKESGIEIEFMFLLDPRDSISIFNNNKIKYYYITTLYLLVKYFIYDIIWKMQKIFNIKILKRFNYIHSIYALHRHKYNFKYVYDNVILIQRNNNESKNKYKINKIFKNKEWHKLNVKKHSDYFSNQSVIKEWMQLLNYYLNKY